MGVREVSVAPFTGDTLIGVLGFPETIVLKEVSVLQFDQLP